jgi:signal transduction histidine kinase
LPDHGLVVARTLGVAIAILSAGLFMAAVLMRFTQFSHPDAATQAGLAQLGVSAAVYAAYRAALDIAPAVACCTVGSLIFWRKSTERLALFVALMLVIYGTQRNTDALVAARPAWELVIKFLGFLAWSSVGLFLYTFPDGQFVPRWTRVPALLWVAVQVPQAFFPNSPFSGPNPLGAILTMSLWSIALFAQIYRYWRISGPIQRQQTKWLVFGLTAAFLVGLLLFLPGTLVPTLVRPDSLDQLYIAPAGELVLLPIPLALGIAILRYRLWDIDPIINRTLVYGGLTACIVGLYVLIVGYLGAVFRTESNLLISLVATGVVAVLFQPLRDRLQRGVNRLMYGERDEPYAVISRLGQRLEATMAPDAVLPTIVQTVREALKLPYAAIALKQADAFILAATDGSPVDAPLILPLVYQNEMVGQLRLGLRASGETFSSADRRLLDDLARQAGVAAHAVRLTADLQHSRQRLVTAREEERRRLRRDLHDGLGPTLASLSMKLDAAQTLVVDDPAVGVALLAEIQGEMKHTIGNVRRLVYALRPPVLDQFGLVGAIREHALHYAQSDGLRVELEAPERLPVLPAAVEVAAYYIALEAITNTARHARAQRCRVRLTLTDAIQLEIVDDGCGLPAQAHFGVGLHAMRERAAELGGTCVIEAVQPSGTHVCVRLPIR